MFHSVICPTHTECEQVASAKLKPSVSFLPFLCTHCQGATEISKAGNNSGKAHVKTALHVRWTMLPGSTAKNLHQIVWVVEYLMYEGTRLGKIIGWILILFWKVSKLIRSYREYANMWSCDARYSNTIGRRKSDGLQTTSKIVRRTSRTVTHHHAIITEL